jgi:hypothetical protein
VFLVLGLRDLPAWLKEARLRFDSMGELRYAARP